MTGNGTDTDYLFKGYYGSPWELNTDMGTDNDFQVKTRTVVVRDNMGHDTGIKRTEIKLA